MGRCVDATISALRKINIYDLEEKLSPSDWNTKLEDNYRWYVTAEIPGWGKASVEIGPGCMTLDELVEFYESKGIPLSQILSGPVNASVMFEGDSAKGLTKNEMLLIPTKGKKR